MHEPRWLYHRHLPELLFVYSSTVERIEPIGVATAKIVEETFNFARLAKTGDDTLGMKLDADRGVELFGILVKLLPTMVYLIKKGESAEQIQSGD